MKKSILLLGIIGVTALNAVAQNGSGSSFSDMIAKVAKKTSGPNRVIVSRPLKGANYNWDYNTSSWMPLDSSFFAYNSQGLETEKSNGANATTLSNRTSTTYDASFRMTESMDEYYDFGTSTWVNQQKHSITFDTQGNYTSDEYFSYNIGTSTWELNSGNLFVNTYNGLDQILTRTTQSYNFSTSAYENDYREINYTYNAFGNPTTWIEESWDGTQWVPSTSYIYTYDANGFPIEAEYQQWDDVTSTFIPVERYTNVVWFNWTGNFDDALDQYSLALEYNTTTATWDTLGQYTITYGANNSLVGVDEVYVNSAFVNDYRYTENIDIQGRTTLIIDENWNTTSSAWEITYENGNVYTYDANDNLTQEINLSWDPTSMVLVNSLRHDYVDFQTFDNTTGLFSNEAASIAVFPNPMNESVTISTAQLNEKVTMIQLVDLNGIVVKTIENINGTTTEIKRDDLKAGLYFVQVKSGASVLAMTKLLVD